MRKRYETVHDESKRKRTQKKLDVTRIEKKTQLTATTVSILGALFKIATLVRIWKPWVARPIAAMVATQVGWEV